MLASAVVLALLLVLGFLDAGHAYSPSPVPSTIIRVLPANEDEGLITFECSYGDAHMADLRAIDMHDVRAVQAGTNSQLMIETTVVNDCQNRDMPMFVILEVRNSSGITIFLAWQNSTINANQHVTIKSSWLASSEPGEYEIRAFYTGCIRCTGLINNVASYQLFLVS